MNASRWRPLVSDLNRKVDSLVDLIREDAAPQPVAKRAPVRKMVRTEVAVVHRDKFNRIESVTKKITEGSDDGLPPVTLLASIMRTRENVEMTADDLATVTGDASILVAKSEPDAPLTAQEIEFLTKRAATT